MDATQAAGVVDALVDTLTGALDVQVIDGQPLLGQPDPDTIIVGFSVGRPAVDVVQEDADVGGGRSETLSIVCLASSWRGGAAMRPVRDRAVELVELVRQALDGDPDLSGRVERVRLGYGMTLDQAQTYEDEVATGAAVTIEFTVEAVTV